MKQLVDGTDNIVGNLAKRGCNISCISEKGPVRAENQDDARAFFAGESVALVVADGMGGHASGREAAEITVSSCSATLIGRTNEDWEQMIARGILTAHERVLDTARHHGTDGMGATVVVAVVDVSRMPPLLHWGHVGDSRAYLYRGRSLYRLTSDHSWVSQMIRDGHLTEEEAFAHPDSNIVQRAIGQAEPLTPETHSPLILDHGDTLVLCSDGVHGALRDSQILRVLERCTDADDVCEQLTEAALHADSQDNVSVACLKLPPARGQGRVTRPSGWAAAATSFSS